MIQYYKLFDLLNRRNMKKTDLLKITSSKTLAKLSKGEIVKTDIIDKICMFLECQPSDIMEAIREETPMNEELTEYTTDEIITVPSTRDLIPDEIMKKAKKAVEEGQTVEIKIKKTKIKEADESPATTKIAYKMDDK